MRVFEWGVIRRIKREEESRKCGLLPAKVVVFGDAILEGGKISKRSFKTSAGKENCIRKLTATKNQRSQQGETLILSEGTDTSHYWNGFRRSSTKKVLTQLFFSHFRGSTLGTRV